VNLPREKLWDKVQADGIPFVTGHTDAAKKMGLALLCGTFSVSVTFVKDLTGLFIERI